MVLLIAAQARANSDCVRGARKDPSVAFLDYIAVLNFERGVAKEKIERSCAMMAYFGDGSVKFDVPGLTLERRVIGKLQSIWPSRRLSEAQEIAGSKVTAAEMRKRAPAFMAKLDEIRRQPDVWERLKRGHELITGLGVYDHSLEKRMQRGEVEAKNQYFNTDPVLTVLRAAKNEPLGVCAHFAALQYFVNKYVGPGEDVRAFEPKLKIGTQHLWNQVRFTQTKTGAVRVFDVDATNFAKFTPLSTSHWDPLLLPVERNKILSECQRMLRCLSQPSQPPPAKTAPPRM